MNLNNIYTYQELCELRNEKTKAGKSKQLQLKEWARYFKWEYPLNPKTKKLSKKFLITEIYDTPLDKVENRGGARVGAGRVGYFAPFMNELIKSLASEKDVIFYTKSEILAKSGLIKSRNYHHLNRCEVKSDDSIAVKSQTYACNSVSDKINNMFFGAFRTAIKHAYKYDINVLNGYLIYDKKDWDNRTLATDKEVALINNVKSEVLDLIQSNDDYMNTLKERCNDRVVDDTLNLDEGLLFRASYIYDYYKEECDKRYAILFNGKVCCKCFVFISNNKLEEFDAIGFEFMKTEFKDIFINKINEHIETTVVEKEYNGNKFVYNKYKDNSNKIYSLVDLKVNNIFE